MGVVVVFDVARVVLHSDGTNKFQKSMEVSCSYSDILLDLSIRLHSALYVELFKAVFDLARMFQVY
jgi:hypothetical protein